jgi:prepilin-type N-terminal cleavage/methylation domain-containing protein
MTRRRRSTGFTLIELVVAITITAIILVFVTMFIAAPVKAYDEQSRRVKLTAGPVDAWPRMEEDLRMALPNSVRTRRNGSFVALEMLNVVDAVRYMQPPAAQFDVAGTFRGVATGTQQAGVYLSVGNTGGPGLNAYTLSGSMTAPSGVTLVPLPPADQRVNVVPAPGITPTALANSPKHWVYLVSGPVTYLCDETQGTIRRYSGYAVLPNQTSWDSPGEFNVAGAPGTLIARGITSCNFVVWPLSGGTQQTVALHLTSTDATGDSVQLLHTWRTEYVP